MFSYLPWIFSQLVQPFNLILMIAGTIIGIIFGAIPGLSATMAIVLFLPITFNMGTTQAFAPNLGKEIAQELHDANVDAVILTST